MTGRSKLESKKHNASKTFFATITKEIIMGGRKCLRNAGHFDSGLKLLLIIEVCNVFAVENFNSGKRGLLTFCSLHD